MELGLWWPMRSRPTSRAYKDNSRPSGRTSNGVGRCGCRHSSYSAVKIASLEPAGFSRAGRSALDTRHGADKEQWILQHYAVAKYGLPSVAEIAAAQDSKRCIARELDDAWAGHVPSSNTGPGTFWSGCGRALPRRGSLGPGDPPSGHVTPREIRMCS